MYSCIWDLNQVSLMKLSQPVVFFHVDDFSYDDLHVKQFTLSRLYYTNSYSCMSRKSYLLMHNMVNMIFETL